MQLNKCSRCGCFFMTNDSVCPNCKPKDMCDIYKLKNYLEDVTPNSTIKEISCNTGITEKNLNRLFDLDEFSDYNYLKSHQPKIEL